MELAGFVSACDRAADELKAAREFIAALKADQSVVGEQLQDALAAYEAERARTAQLTAQLSQAQTDQAALQRALEAEQQASQQLRAQLAATQKKLSQTRRVGVLLNALRLFVDLVL